MMLLLGEKTYNLILSNKKATIEIVQTLLVALYTHLKRDLRLCSCSLVGALGR